MDHGALLTALEEFYRAFPTEKECLQALAPDSPEGTGLPCPVCGRLCAVSRRIASRVPMPSSRGPRLKGFAKLRVLTRLVALCPNEKCRHSWHPLAVGPLRGKHQSTLHYWFCLAWLAVHPKSRELLTGSALSWLQGARVLPGSALVQAMVKGQLDDWAKLGDVLEAECRSACVVEGMGQADKHPSPKLKLLVEAYVQHLSPSAREPRLPTSFLQGCSAPLQKAEGLLADLALRALNKAGISPSQAVGRLAPPPPVLAGKVPQKLQEQLLLLREGMARVVWGSRGAPKRKQLWGKAKKVLLEAAPLVTVRNKRQYARYIVVLLVRLSRSRAVETRSIVVPKDALPQAIESLASRFSVKHWQTTYVIGDVPSSPPEGDLGENASTTRKRKVQGFGVCEIASDTEFTHYKKERGTQWMRDLQKWLCARGRLKDLREGKQARKACPADLSSPEWQNVDLAQHSFLHTHVVGSDWRNQLFYPLVQALLSSLPARAQDERK